MKRVLVFFLLAACLAGCSSDKKMTQNKVSVSAAAPDGPERERMQRGIDQCAALWRAEDGSQADFEAFVRQWLATTPEARRTLYDKLARALETLRSL